MVSRPEMDSRVRWDVRALGLCWLAACLVLLYAFDMGRGFVKDDFGWILHSRLAGWLDVRAAFADPQGGFFRPLVALSFGIDERLFGLAPMAYAVTNLVVVLATVAAVSVLGESLGLDRPAGIVAAAFWGLNFHGVPGALMWISGRTSLLTTFFAVLAAIAVARRRHLAGGALTFCALLSKEEPVLLPVVFATWAVLDLRGAATVQSEEPRLRDIVGTIVRRAGPSFAALAAYLLLRSRSHAFTPSTAPSYYQLSVSPFVIAANAFQYLDRSCTFIAAVLLVSVVLFARRRPRMNATERLVVIKGAVWLALGFGVTILIPARSSLYVCFPSIGSALAGAAVGTAIWRGVPATRRSRAFVLLLVPIVLLPVYRARNRRLKDEATLSARVLSRLGEARSATGEVRAIVVYDQPAVHPSIASAFGELLPDAVELTTGVRVPVDVRPSPPTAAERADPHPAGVLRFELTDGDVRPLL